MATTTEMDKHCALLALVREGPDKAAAAAVTAFAGDINTCSPKGDTVLYVALVSGRPLTVAALAARGDCNPNTVTRNITRRGITTRPGTPMLSLVAGPYSRVMDMVIFLAHFPTLDVDASDETGYTPLHYAAHWGRNTNAQLLLDAGADPTVRSLNGFTPAELALRSNGRLHCSTKLLEAAAARHSGLRRGWLRAVVGISKM